MKFCGGGGGGGGGGGRGRRRDSGVVVSLILRYLPPFQYQNGIRIDTKFHTCAIIKNSHCVHQCTIFIFFPP
ncbi:Hypothetical predicted protein [Octopus vulgaris]|uniref:Uncharacterized protein n=1 Tax=Octopus vulgaris TaxID=6645 RepID=A0AA36B8F4_OCTVU|nr:Hypothetical predicted protein [Octopus vulgaris]